MVIETKHVKDLEKDKVQFIIDISLPTNAIKTRKKTIFLTSLKILRQRNDATCFTGLLGTEC